MSRSQKHFRLPARVTHTIAALAAAGQLNRAIALNQEASDMEAFYAEHPEMIESFTRLSARHTTLRRADAIGIRVDLHDVKTPAPAPRSAPRPKPDPARVAREKAIALEVQAREEERAFLAMLDEMCEPTTDASTEWAAGASESQRKAESMRAAKREKVLFPGNGKGEQGTAAVVPPVVGEWWRPGWDATERIPFFSPKGGR
jgi:hypothetical protein